MIKITSANMAFMSWSEITGMHLISCKGNRVEDISGEIFFWQIWLIWRCWGLLNDDLIIASDPVFVDGDVFRIKQLAAWTVFPCKDCHCNYSRSNFWQWNLTKLVVWRAAGVHEGLGDDTEAGVDDVRLPEVEHKVGVLDQVDPEPAQHLVRKSYWRKSNILQAAYKGLLVLHIWILNFDTVLTLHCGNIKR